ncbi:MAG: hypothetical protein ABI612_03275 [Betaproteobacteria bacterium]
MAISPASFFAPTMSIIPPVTLPQLSASNPALNALRGTRANAAPALASLQALAPQREFVAALEQLLFTNSATGLQPVSSDTLGPAIESLLASALGLSAPIPTEARGIPFDASNPLPVAITAQILSLFGSIQLLGTDTNPTPTIGSLLDLAA